jgi:hypothetical protein
MRSTSPLVTAAALVVLLIAAILSSPAHGQAAITGSIGGSVTDDTGNFLPGASITVAGEPLGDATRTAITDAEGNFTVAGLRVGVYNLTAEMIGHRSVEIMQIVVDPDLRRHFDITLAEGLTERVTVLAERPLVDKGITSAKEVIDANFVNRLPLISRRYQQILPLFPGVTNDEGFNLAQYHINGGRVTQTGYRLDGATINDFVTGTFGLNVNQNSIERFELNTAGFQAEYGEQSAGVANIITKSGTNDFELLYSGFYRTDAWGAKLPGFSELVSRADADGLTSNNNNPLPETQQWQELSLAGPFARNRAWFAASFQYWQEDVGSIFNDSIRTGDRYNGQFKTTWQISPKNTFVANIATDPARFGNLITDARFAEGTNYDQRQGGYFVQLRDTHTLSPGALIESQLFVHHQYLEVSPSERGLGPFEIIVDPGQPLLYTGTYPSDQDRDTDRIRLSSAVTVQKRTHRIKAGLDYSFLDFTGVVTARDVIVNFDSIAVAYHGPGSTLNYTYSYLNPDRTDRSDTEAAAYVQDSWVINEHWTVEGGLRWDHQSIIGAGNVAPRVGAAFDPKGRGRTKIYANYGRFYDNVFVDFVDFVDTDGATQSLNYYYADSGASFSGVLYAYDYATDGEIEAPYKDSWTVGFEQELPWEIRLGMSATGWKGRNQLRATYTSDLGTVPPGVELDPAANAAVILDSKGRADYRDWKLILRKPFSHGFELLGSYTRSRVRGDTSEDFGFENRADQRALDFTRLSYDRPDVINFAAFGNLPLGLEFTTVYRYQSGRLFSPLTYTGEIDTSVGGKNSQRMPPQRSLDLALAKRFPLGRGQMKLAGQVFNLTNELNVIDVDRFTGSGPAFAQPVSVDFGRTFQIGLEFRYQ